MGFKSKIVQVDPQRPAPKTIMKAASVVRSGGVIAFPTRCLYGLGADAFNTEAVRRIFSIKQRPDVKPVLILIADVSQLDRLVKNVTEVAADIMRKFWPGEVTLVFEAGDVVPPVLTGGSGKIGIRLPGHPVASALVKAVAGPVTGTSANLSGDPGCHRIEDLVPQVARQLDLILNAGPLKGGSGSTVVDVTAGKPRILREGTISADEIMNLVEL
ncbi:MAG: threonylcarbamoyl-AMP synthase [Desulfobacterales bacterium]|nr:MAG: threonylcarbamoyl-AMP synthase [Desulfobacterales bacterium]